MLHRGGGVCILGCASMLRLGGGGGEWHPGTHAAAGGGGGCILDAPSPCEQNDTPVRSVTTNCSLELPLRQQI